MALQKTEAIVLKSQKQGETSKILTVYTRAFGKITLIAKGARHPKSRFVGSLEPLNYIAVVFYEKETRDLQFLSQADILETFPEVHKSLEKTTLAMAACELVNRLESGVSPNPLLFRLLLQTLRGINGATKRPGNCLRAFQVKMLGVLGFRPNLKSCLNCGHSTATDVTFDVGRGGYVCGRCDRRSTAGVVLSREALTALRAFQVAPCSRLENYLPSPAAQRQVDEFLFHYFHYHVEGFAELNALKFLRKLNTSLEA